MSGCLVSMTQTPPPPHPCWLSWVCRQTPVWTRRRTHGPTDRDTQTAGLTDAASGSQPSGESRVPVSGADRARWGLTVSGYFLYLTTVDAPVCLPACLSVCISVCLSACLPACLPVCLPATQTLSSLIISCSDHYIINQLVNQPQNQSMNLNDGQTN